MKRVMKMNEKKEPNIIGGRIVDIVTGDDFNLSNCMNAIGTISEYELYDYTSKNYHYIIQELFLNHNEKKYKTLLDSAKFIMVLQQALIDVSLSEEELVGLNQYIYMSIVYQKTDLFMRKILFGLGEIINKPIVNSLISLGTLDHELCIFLAISYKSSPDPYMNVKRINFALCDSSKNILSVEDLTYIFYKLYSESFSNLFIGTMFDRSIIDDEENGEEWVTDTLTTINDNITIAVLNLMETMQPIDIYNLLVKFINKWTDDYCGNREAVRCSIKNICMNDRRYTKIFILIQELEGQGLMVP